MEKIDNSQYMLVEKYRPQTLNDMILPQEMKDQVKEWLDNERVPNMLLSSISPGLGKCLSKNEVIEINITEELLSTYPGLGKYIL